MTALRIDRNSNKSKIVPFPSTAAPRKTIPKVSPGLPNLSKLRKSDAKLRVKDVNKVVVKMFDRWADDQLTRDVKLCQQIINQSPHGPAVLAEITGLSLTTVSKMGLGLVKSPHHRTVLRIKALNNSL